MEKIDLKKKLKHLYKPSTKEVVQVDVPTMNYLMVDGEGDPYNSQAFSDAVEALFAVSYALKFMIKKGPPLRKCISLLILEVSELESITKFTSAISGKPIRQNGRPSSDSQCNDGKERSCAVLTNRPAYYVLKLLYELL